MNRSRDHLISRYFVKDYKMLSKTFRQINQIFPKIFGYSFACANFGELFILRVGLYGVCEFCVKFSRTDDFKSLQEGQYHEKDFSA